MSYFYLPIDQQITIVDSLIQKAESALAKRPIGRLTVQKNHTSTQYIYRPSPDATRQYIRKENLSFIKALAQKEYEESFLRAADAQKKELQKVKARSSSHMYHALAAPFARLSKQRKLLVNPYVLPDDLYIQSFLQQPYDRKEFEPFDPIIMTENGERVRSKSEKILADKLKSMGIPYLYERPLFLSQLGHVHPDFTLLDIQERCIVFHEHFGRMDKPSYVSRSLNKIECYIEDGYLPGEKLLFTFEGGDQILDITHFEKIMQARFFS